MANIRVYNGDVIGQIRLSADWLATALNADGDGAWVSRMPQAIEARPARQPPVDARVP